MNRRQFLSGGFGFAAGLSAAAPLNVVIIMSDDHGAWSLGCYGNLDAHTPNIDGLAAGGVHFTRSFAASAVCSPCRMSYITGKIPSQHGVQDYILAPETSGPGAKRFLDGHTTYPEILARHGYTLGFCGKWHMGDDAHPQKDFTHWLTLAGAGGPYRNPAFNQNGRTQQVQGYKTDLLTDDALAFLEANREKAFFLEVCYNAPHTPYDYQPEKYRAPYANSSFPAFPNEPPHPNQIAAYRQYLGKRESKWSYMALVRGLDENVGRIVRKLDALRLRARTLVIFCADQGFNCGHHGVWGKGNGTLPFNMYEETIRIPTIYNLPGRIPAGRTCDAMIATYDFLPTLLDLLGLAPHRDPQLAGRSYAGFLPWSVQKV